MERPLADKTGAEAMVTTMKEHDVERVYVYVGGAALPMFDAMQTVGEGMDMIHTRHEAGATFMAQGEAEASGKPGSVFVTSGPGFTNAVTGLMTAQMDSSPMVVFSGQVPTFAPPDAFQSAKSTDIAQHVTKYAAQARTAADMPGLTHDAYQIAKSGRPGSVLIDVPKDVGGGKVGEEPNQPEFAEEDKPYIEPGVIREVIAAWRRAERPVILAGHGVIISGGAEELRELAERMDTPVTNTLLGKGAFPETHDLSLGMLGMHGTAYANKAIERADFLINIGSRFDDRITGNAAVFAKGAFKVHVDIDKGELGKIINPNIGVTADGREFLQAMLGELALQDADAESNAAWNDEIAANKAEFPLSYETGNGLTMQQVIDETYKYTGGDAIVTTDVGQHQMWAAQFWKTDAPRTWISSGGAGTMGFGMPAAIGAQFAQPDKRVIAFVGDGGFQMTMNELATASRHKLPIKCFVLDNQYLGMVRQWQDAFYDGRQSGVDMSDNPDFAKIAEASGAAGIVIDSEENLQSGIEEAFAINDRPVVIHVKVRKDDNVFPFIPAGGAYSEMQTGPSNVKLAQPKGST